MPYTDITKQRRAQREYAARNRKVINTKRDDMRIERALYIRSKKNHSCMDCGVQYPPYVMDFDHVRGEKKIEIAKMANMCSTIDDIDGEIAKCDLVCANCHRLRHGDPMGNRLKAGQQTLNL